MWIVFFYRFEYAHNIYPEVQFSPRLDAHT